MLKDLLCNKLKLRWESSLQALRFHLEDIYDALFKHLQVQRNWYLDKEEASDSLNYIKHFKFSRSVVI